MTLALLLPRRGEGGPPPEAHSPCRVRSCGRQVQSPVPVRGTCSGLGTGCPALCHRSRTGLGGREEGPSGWSALEAAPAPRGGWGASDPRKSTRAGRSGRRRRRPGQGGDTSDHRSERLPGPRPRPQRSPPFSGGGRPTSAESPAASAWPTRARSTASGGGGVRLSGRVDTEGVGPPVAERDSVEVGRGRFFQGGARSRSLAGDRCPERKGGDHLRCRGETSPQVYEGRPRRSDTRTPSGTPPKVRDLLPDQIRVPEMCRVRGLGTLRSLEPPRCRLRGRWSRPSPPQIWSRALPATCPRGVPEPPREGGSASCREKGDLLWLGATRPWQ